MDSLTKSFANINRYHTRAIQELGAEKLRREILEREHQRVTEAFRELYTLAPKAPEYWHADAKKRYAAAQKKAAGLLGLPPCDV